MKKVTVLGATGSIGKSAIDVILQNRDSLEVHALVARQDAARMFELVRQCSPAYAALADPKGAAELRGLVASAGIRTEVITGMDEIHALCGDRQADYVVCAIVGAAGLRPAMEAVRASRTILLANKEALVMTGQLFFEQVRKHGARVLPLDSEHSAIFQCLPSEVQENLGFCSLREAGVHRILLTGSGGPFRQARLEDLEHVTAQSAVSHPVWSMGPKISVDSATMMNKGLEYIEARYLFNAGHDDIEVVIHPQAIIHSMVSYIDGAVLAQMGLPDMRTPIARALGFPGRIGAGVRPLDFYALGDLSFERPDLKRYPCLGLAMESSRQGQGATTALNAANEEAVGMFLRDEIGFMDIHRLCDRAVEKFCSSTVSGLEDVFELDARTREYVRSISTGGRALA